MTNSTGTSSTTFAGETARVVVAQACDRLELDRDAVLRQFDAWGYSPANLSEIASWPESSEPWRLDSHCRLLAAEAAAGVRP